MEILDFEIRSALSCATDHEYNMSGVGNVEVQDLGITPIIFICIQYHKVYIVNKDAGQHPYSANHGLHAHYH